MKKNIKPEELPILWSSISNESKLVQGIHERKDGKKFPTEVHLSKISIEKHEYILASVRDITASKKAKEKLHSYAEELKRSNQELENFAAIASHDLKEPLRKIITFGDFLQNDEPDLKDRSKDYLKRMLNASVRMGNLIDDLLKYSIVSTDKKLIVPIELTEVLAQVINDLEVKISSTNAKINHSKLPRLAMNPSQAHQLFLNLIANALKFHREGIPPIINIDCEYIQEKKSWKINIKDNGIGLDEKYSERIFRMFERLHGRGAFKGTGIGLAICKKIALLHEGSISVQSKTGEGSTFSVTLPDAFGKTVD